MSADILEGVTRATVIDLCCRLGVEVVERSIDRTELYEADELFQCGTGSEIIPVGTVDGVTVGARGVGSITSGVIELYERIVRAGGRLKKRGTITGCRRFRPQNGGDVLPDPTFGWHH